MANPVVTRFPALHNVIRTLALVIFLAVVVYGFMLSLSDDGVALRAKLSQLAMQDLIIPILLSLVSYLLRFWRWRLILSAFGHRLPLAGDVIFYLSGFALTMTPGKSGETIRSAFLLQANVPVQSSLSAFIIERSFDLVIVGVIATLFYLPVYITLLIFLVFMVSLALLAPRMALLLDCGELHAQRSRVMVIIYRVLNMLSRALMILRPQSVVLYALLGAAAWGAQGLGFYFIVSVFSGNMDVVNAIGTYCVGLFAGAASLIPGGIGVTEGSLAWLLQYQGLDQNSAILSALISRGCTLWLAVVIGCGALLAIIKGFTLSKHTHLTSQQYNN